MNDYMVYNTISDTETFHANYKEANIIAIGLANELNADMEIYKNRQDEQEFMRTVFPEKRLCG